MSRFGRRLLPIVERVVKEAARQAFGLGLSWDRSFESSGNGRGHAIDAIVARVMEGGQ